MENQADSIGGRIGIMMKDQGLNKNSLTVKLGLQSNSVIGRIVNDPTRSPSYELLKAIVTLFRDYNARWIVTGEGDRYSKELAKTYEKGEIKYFRIGPGEKFTDEIVNGKATAVNIAYGFSDCEYAFDVIGDSMAPRFRPGDVIFCNKHNGKPVSFGEAYYMVINETPSIRVIVNHDNEDNYIVSSENSRYSDYKIKQKDITHLYLIKGLLRREVF